ncbi:MAG: hypothetical protein IJQ81_17795 [Oscillibacter sp.]|nr:hypothetical protein [Oscillibacter sp.]
MGSISKKLKSERGVTILLALLLFLVCAVTGSVVITAGTAASGTISERAKLDQRYFSVTSAAELLRDEFNKDSSVSVTVEYNENGEWSGNRLPNVDTTDTKEKFIIDQSLYLLNKRAQSDTADSDLKCLENMGDVDVEGNARQWFFKPDGAFKLYSVTVSNINANDEVNVDKLKDTVKATVEIQPESDDQLGELNFIIKSAIPGKDKNKIFSLKMKYIASVFKTVKSINGRKEVTFQVTWQMTKVSLTTS